MKSTTGAVKEHSSLWKLHITRQSISVRERSAKKHLVFSRRVFLASAEPTGVMKCKRTNVKKQTKKKTQQIVSVSKCFPRVARQRLGLLRLPGDLQRLIVRILQRAPLLRFVRQSLSIHLKKLSGSLTVNKPKIKQESHTRCRFISQQM